MTTAATFLDLGVGLGGEAKYERLTRQLMSNLADGSLKPGDALPTEVELAERLAISRTTVRQAFAELERRGVIRRVRGKGTFINETYAVGSSSPDDNKAQQHGLYALVLPEVEHGFYPSLQRNFSDVAERHRKHVIVCNTDSDTFRQADILLQLADRKVEGIALVPTSNPERPTQPHQLRPLQELGIPLVFCHRRVEGVEAPLVTYSGLEVGRTAADAMVRAGHRRVAVFFSHRMPMTQPYLEGLRERFAAAGIALPDDMVHYGHRLGHVVTADHESHMRRKLESLFASPTPPTAIFTSFDSEAELMFLQLAQMGLKVPEDVSLLGIGGVTRVGGFAQRLTSVTVNECEVAHRAAELLMQMHRREKQRRDMDVSLVTVSLSDGRTLGPPRGA